jgi:hypothetical protein
MGIPQVRIEANQEETIAKMDAHQERMGASMNALRKETTACQEAMGACLESKEPASMEKEPVAVHEEVPKEEAAVKTVRPLRKWHLDAGRRRQLKKRTHGDRGSRKKLTTAREK